MLSDGRLSEIPPVSKVMPLPTRATRGTAPAGDYRSRTSRGGRDEPRPTARSPPQPSVGEPVLVPDLHVHPVGQDGPGDLGELGGSEAVGGAGDEVACHVLGAGVDRRPLDGPLGGVEVGDGGEERDRPRAHVGGAATGRRRSGTPRAAHPRPRLGRHRGPTERARRGRDGAAAWRERAGPPTRGRDGRRSPTTRRAGRARPASRVPAEARSGEVQELAEPCRGRRRREVPRSGRAPRGPRRSPARRRRRGRPARPAHRRRGRRRHRWSRARRAVGWATPLQGSGDGPSLIQRPPPRLRPVSADDTRTRILDAALRPDPAAGHRPHLARGRRRRGRGVPPDRLPPRRQPRGPAHRTGPA